MNLLLILALGAPNRPAMSILERSCADCHSAQTSWPWYSHVPPLSWMIQEDVSKAREHMDFSRWEQYTKERRRQFLGSIAANVRNAQMPPSRYLLLHREARLTPEEVKTIEQWTRDERRRLRE